MGRQGGAPILLTPRLGRIRAGAWWVGPTTGGDAQRTSRQCTSGRGHHEAPGSLSGHRAERAVARRSP